MALIVLTDLGILNLVIVFETVWGWIKIIMKQKGTFDLAHIMETMMDKLN